MKVFVAASLRGMQFSGAATAAMLLLGAACLPAQQHPDPMGTVPTRDGRLNGGLEVQGETARLLSNASVTAYDRNAPVTLQRGGNVLVCSTSEFHLLRSGAAGALIFGLDRGALEIQSESKLQDAVLTPDLKFVPVTKGTLDLRLRVTREGDTCVDNGGANAPVLNVTDPFSAASYRVLPGQHLLFVNGDLHKVVDHERSACGCPAVPAAGVAAKTGQPLTPAAAAAAAPPFPAAQSEGLAPTPPPTNAAPVGMASSQVTTTFNYGEGVGRPPSLGESTSASSSTAPGATSTRRAATSAPQQTGFFHAIGHFFRRVFGGSRKP